jgi:hypothetical protein
MQDDGIAILYSYPSVFAHELDEGKSFGGYEEAHSSLINFIRNAGFQFRYVTDRMLRLGEFDASQYKILFLPRAEAIGDSEAQVIRRFVENGGTVVADFRPGLYDDHCKPREKGVLDDLFGIQRILRTGAAEVNIQAGNSRIKTFADLGIKLVDAQAMQLFEGSPVFVFRKAGKGKAILLNSEMSRLSPLLSALNITGAVNPGTQNGFFSSTFWGFKPVIKVERLDGGIPEKVEITRWRNDRIDIISFFRKGGAAEEIAVSLPKEKFVYNLRARNTLGSCKRFTTTILPNRASFFVLTDNPVSAPRIGLDSTTAQQGSVLEANLSVRGAEGMHAVKMRIHAGDRHLEWYDKTLIVGQKPIRVEIPVALNDPVGDYRIILNDLFSNETNGTTLKVKPNH